MSASHLPPPRPAGTPPAPRARHEAPGGHAPLPRPPTGRASSPAIPRFRLATGLLILGLGLTYWLLAPGTVDGDGIGYLRRIPGSGLAPGHLAYLPLARLLTPPGVQLTGLELVPLLRGLSILAALAALLLFHAGARLVCPPGPALFATAFLGVSHAFSRSAAEIEVYAPTTLMVVATLWALLHFRRAAATRSSRADLWAVLAGLCCGGGVLLHLTISLLGVSMVLLLRRWSAPGQQLRSALLGVAAALLVTLTGLLLALDHQGHQTLAAAWTWLRSADHGIPYPRAWSTPLIALWGLDRSLIHAPYLHEASLLRVLTLSGIGLLAWSTLIRRRWRLHRQGSALPATAADRTSPLELGFLLTWSIPLGLFAVCFFPSDTERWIFIMPALALFFAPLAGRATWLVLAGIAVVNTTAYTIPQALDRAPAARARSIERLVNPGDLVVLPGHGWDEGIGLGQSHPPRRLCLVHLTGSERDLARATLKLHQSITRTLDVGQRVFVARLHEDGDSRGFKELAWFGLPRGGFAALFAPYRPVPTSLPYLWQLTLSAPVTSETR